MPMTLPMTRFSLMLRTLRYFGRANLAVVVGIVVATAVLSGALMVGDCVQGSLRDLAVRRLGRVDDAMLARQFVGQDLAARISHLPGFKENFADCAAALILSGGATTEDGSLATGGVRIMAVDGWINVAPGSCLINGELADSLGIAAAGATLRLQLPQIQATPRDDVLAHRGWNQTTAPLTLRVAAIARQPGMESMFNLAGGQRVPRIAWVNRADLQDAVGQIGRVNAILVTRRPRSDGDLNALLRQAITLDDYGLTGKRDGDELVVNSQATYLSEAVIAAARSAGYSPTLVSAYLINTVAKIPSGPEIHYAIAVGMSSLSLKADEVALNSWAAEHLHAAPGGILRLDYYQRASNGDLVEVRRSGPELGLPFRVSATSIPASLDANPTLTPSYDGLTDSPTEDQWDAPKGVTIKKDWITRDDEAYWKAHRAAPKLFLNLDSARKLWGGDFGSITSLRIPITQAASFQAHLLFNLDPAALGLAFRPIKAQQIAASSGSGEFAMTFLSFSFFLIAAAVLLTAMLFRLGIEQRARQIGLLSAVGFSPSRLRRMALGEGMLLALIGVVIGSGAAVGYTALMIAGLRTRWIGAIGTTQLYLHINPLTLVTGALATLTIAFLAILWGVRRVGRTTPAELLAGRWMDMPSRINRPGIMGLIGAGFAVLGVVLLLMGALQMISIQPACMGAAACFMVWLLKLLGRQLRRRVTGHRRAAQTLAALGIRNAALRPGRSILTVALVACATFILAIVAAMRQQGPSDLSQRNSGSGGFALMLRADIPMLGNLATPAGREMLGLQDPDAPIWSQAAFVSLRRWAGQDASCLNMTHPTDPTLLAASPELVRRNAFAFAQTVKTIQNPWELLNVEDAAKTVPIIADANTAQYILHIPLDGKLTLHDAAGKPYAARLVATLAGSIFQSELLMSEANFRRRYPDQDGFGVVLIDAPAEVAGDLRKQLASELSHYAVTVDSTRDVLAMYDQVANTYLATFQTLGSLGLLLGTLGLAVALLRGLAERRGELAMLAAIGLSSGQRMRLVLAENVFLLAAGLLMGLLCAAVAAAPAVIGSDRHIQFAGLLPALAIVLLAGLAALILALALAGRKITLADLRRE